MYTLHSGVTYLNHRSCCWSIIWQE